MEAEKKLFAIEPQNVMYPPEVTLETRIPGLKLLENFITMEEENNIILRLDEKDIWIQEMSRRVQHFGFPFNYRNLMLDFSTETPKFPEEVEVVAKRIENGLNSAKGLAISMSLENFDSNAGNDSFLCTKHLNLPLSQVTVNEYLANQGIAPHVDTSACFGPLVFIVSCGCGTTMTFKKISPLGTGELETRNDPVKEHVWLPRRSLLILCSDARYLWSHGIASRKFDKINGSLLERKRRVSLTFRQALLPGEIPAENLRASLLEQKNVFDFYDEVAEHWHHTRGKRKVHWHRVKEFLTSLPKGSLLADIGSGDGKYFGINHEIVSIGCDRSLNLLKISKNIGHETFCCDAVKIPFRENCFDASICIAVMHHLCNLDRRIAVIRELMRITKTGGSILLQAWAMEQEEHSKREFVQQDVMVPWRLQKRFVSIAREEKSVSVMKHYCDQRGIIMSGSDTCNSLNDLKDEICILEDKIDRFDSKKSSALSFDSNLTTDSTEKESNPGSDRIDGRDNLITYERYCHMYKNGELDHLCSSIPGCKIIDRGFDRSNWFVLIKKVDDPRIFVERDDYTVSIKNDEVANDHGGGKYNQSPDIHDDSGRRQIRSTALAQPMPHITLRTLV